MPKKKNYTLTTNSVVKINATLGAPWEIKTNDNTFDFRRWLYLGRPILSGREAEINPVCIDREEIVIAIRNAVWRLKQVLADATIHGFCASGVASWFFFLDHMFDSGKKILNLEKINSELIEQYIEWLKFRPADTKTGQLSYSAAKSVYTQTKTVLVECITIGAMKHDIFPKNPFPNSNRARNSYKSYSKNELLRLLQSLAKDLLEIRQKVFKGTDSEKLAVYFFLIAARTGRNLTPLLEMTRDALQPHPLNPKTRSLLILYKRRGNNISLQEFRKTINVKGIASINSDVSSLFKDVLELTQQYIPLVPERYRNNLWLCKRDTTNHLRGLIAPLNSGMLFHASKRLIQRYNLGHDDSETKLPAELNLSTAFLRKTFSKRIWQLTNGDIIKTAAALGNQPPITDAYYLEVTPEMEHKHKFTGLCLEATLRGKENDQETKLRIASVLKVTVEEVERVLNGKNNTGVGRCTSPFYGAYAPKDGKNACTNFLYCFQCPNQVVMESDLYRLFSFYWLIIKERNLMDRKRWKKVYSWVIREIDRIISPKFKRNTVKEERVRAYNNPHPMWRDRALLGGAYG